MNLIEFIGFVISLIAMFILFFSRSIEKRRQRTNPQLYEAMESRKKETLKQFLEALDVQHDDAFDDEDDEGDEDEVLASIRLQPHPETVREKAPLYSSVAALRPGKREEQNFLFRSKTDEYKLETAIDKQRLNASLEEKYTPGFLKSRQTDAWAKETGEPDPYALRQDSEASRATRALERTGSLQDVVILREILGPPKALSQNDGSCERF